MTRLPAVTVGRLPQIPAWRLASAAGAAILAVAAMVGARAEQPAALPPQLSLAGGLAPSSLAVRVPHAWLAAAPPRLAPGDRVDVIGSRGGERAAAVNVVVDARVLEADNDAVVLELAADDATATIVARANAYLLLLLLRPKR